MYRVKIMKGVIPCTVHVCTLNNHCHTLPQPQKYKSTNHGQAAIFVDWLNINAYD